VEWSIPRFTLKKTLDLEDGLTALGLGELFDRDGNPLSLLSGDGTPAYVGKAEQGTAISIDEVGCEAASYVKVEATTGSAEPPEDLVRMYLSRPFVFAILSENDVPLFLGVVNNPNG
jgi:serpin B